MYCSLAKSPGPGLELYMKAHDYHMEELKSQYEVIPAQSLSLKVMFSVALL